MPFGYGWEGKGMQYKVDADGGDVGFSVCVICKSKKKTRLSDSTVSYKKKSAQSQDPHDTTGEFT